jgi:DNA repair protein SbcD/Mre11
MTIVTPQHEPDQVGTLVHAADLHLGAPLNSLGAKVGEDQARALRDQAVQAFDRLIELTLAQQAEVLVLAGDLYDQAEYEVRAQVRFANAMRRLVEAGVHVFIAHGNHDPLVANFKPAATLPPEVTVFAPNNPQVHTVRLRSGHEVQVAGVSFGKAQESANLAQRFHHLATDPRATIGVLHTNVGSNTQHGDYAPCTSADLDMAPVGYWALGHIHDRTVYSLGSGRWWAYPGNLQGRSTKATECGPKGALVVPILSDGFGEPVFHACDTVRFLRADLDMSNADNLGDALERIDAHLNDLEQQADGRSLVVRLRLIGSSPAHAVLSTTVDLVDLIREQLTSSALLATVEVATRPRVDREQVLARNNLHSDVLRTLDTVTDPEAMLWELLGNQVPTGAVPRLREHLHADPHLASALLTQVESLLTELLEDPS